MGMRGRTKGELLAVSFSFVARARWTKYVRRGCRTRLRRRRPSFGQCQSPRHGPSRPRWRRRGQFGQVKWTRQSRNERAKRTERWGERETRRTSSCPTSAMKQTTVYPSSISQARMQEVSVERGRCTGTGNGGTRFGRRSSQAPSSSLRRQQTQTTDQTDRVLQSRRAELVPWIQEQQGP